MILRCEKFKNVTYPLSISNENMMFKITKKKKCSKKKFFLNFLFLAIYLAVIDENTLLRIVFRIYCYTFIFLNDYYFFFCIKSMQIYLNIINTSSVILYTYDFKEIYWKWFLNSHIFYFSDAFFVKIVGQHGTFHVAPHLFFFNK